MSSSSTRLRSALCRPRVAVHEVLSHYLLGHSLWACVLVVLLSLESQVGSGDRDLLDTAREES